MWEMVGNKHGGKFEKLKNDNNNVLENKGDHFQDKLLKNVLENEKKDDKHNAKVLSLKNELKENIVNLKKWKKS